MANQFLSLALFIMLLSFFIILNALSNFEEVKSKPVLSSIAMTFSNQAPEEILSPNTVEAPEESNKEGDTLDKLEALFNANIAGLKVQKNRLGTTMQITLPIEQFENSLRAPTSSTRTDTLQQRRGSPGTFMPVLISLMQTRETEIPYRMDMVLNTDKSPAKSVIDDTAQLKRDQQKVASLAKRLEESGLQKKLISAGLAQGDSKMINIYFTRYTPVNPLEDNTP